MGHGLTAVALVLAGWCVAGATMAAPQPRLDLEGFADSSGAISVQYRGQTVDPYFALQALLLAQDSGLDASSHAVAWANWLAPRQKPDGTFDRFCRTGPVWSPCKTADADDALMALWLKFLGRMPSELARNQHWRSSRDAAAGRLRGLFDPVRNVYMVSPVYQHGLLMDNLEVWTYEHAQETAGGADRHSLARSILEVFWDARAGRFLVSTQAGQRNAEPRFYPDAVAQIYPLVVNFPHIPGGRRAWYEQWMNRHRAEWLLQSRTDFAWGLIALVAANLADRASARCWLRMTAPSRLSVHWTVTDEVVAQVLTHRGIAPAVSDPC